MEPWKDASADAIHLIKNLLVMDVEKRYTCKQALEHTWVEKLAPNSSGKKISAAAVSNLKGFRAQNKLKKAALTVIRPAFFIHQVEIDVQGLRSVFEKTSCKKKLRRRLG